MALHMIHFGLSNTSSFDGLMEGHQSKPLGAVGNLGNKSGGGGEFFGVHEEVPPSGIFTGVTLDRG